jgi:hypothetical protein
LPPRTNWPRTENPERVDEFRLYWALRELKRIQVAGGILPEDDLNWLQGRINRFPEVAGMSRVDEGFMGTLEARLVLPNPDGRFDQISGVERLAALEADLKSSRRAWDDYPAGRAGDWIQDRTNARLLLPDFEAAADAEAAYPRVWDRFGWGHVPSDRDDDQLRQEARRVLSLLRQLPLEAARFAIDGISNWLSVWRKLVVDSSNGFVVWHRLWPIAVDATNEHAPPPAAEESNSLPGKPSSDLDTLNTSVGKLLDVFLAACPGLNTRPHPFADGDEPRSMRDIAVAAPGRSGLIVRHRMIESLPYFLNADAQWTRNFLIAPLITDSGDALALWRAIARRTQFTDVLRIIGGPMAERALDLRLPRDTRRPLVFSLVVECLHALREARSPAVPYPRIQQMLRMIDDEVRAHAADTVAKFVRDLSAPQRGGQASTSREELFRRAVVPFLKDVWPQERSLVTQGVGRAFADLPAAVGECFVDAVELVERFLVPFDCWSMFEYGFHASENRTPLSSINNVAKGEALLRLLNVTVGTSEGAIIPHDLAEALTQIEKVVPKAVNNPVFRRLATLARRS